MVLVKKVISDIVFFHLRISVIGLSIAVCKMKIAKVITIYKTGGKLLFSNNRPVYLLSQLSKILEYYTYISGSSRIN